jgi:hypothetical protein
MKPELYDVYKRVMTKFGDVYLADRPPLCRAINLEEMMGVLDAGQIVCRGYDHYLDSHFIPGDFTHSGVVINRREIIHSIAEGVESIHPMDFVMDCDRFVVLQPSYSPILEVKEIQVSKVVDRAIWHCEHNKTEYDFTFSDDNKFYCHEFSVDCIEKMGLVVAKSHLIFGIWPFKFVRELYLAQNLIDVCKIVYMFNPSGGRK